MKNNIWLEIAFIAFLGLGGIAEAFTLHVVEDVQLNRCTDCGASPDIQIKASSLLGVLKFNMKPLATIDKENILSANLKLFVTSVKDEGPFEYSFAENVYGVYSPEYDGPFGEWTEELLEGRNSPRSKYQKTKSITKDMEGHFISLDVTSFLMENLGEDYLSIKLHWGKRPLDVTFSSKESGGNAPQIEVLLKSETEIIESMQGQLSLLDGEIATITDAIQEIKELLSQEKEVICGDGFEIITTVRKHGRIQYKCEKINMD